MPARRLDLALALASGGLLTLMVLFNGEMGRHTTALFSSWAAHATGSLAAALALALGWALGQRRRPAADRPRAPFWAYLAGLSGAVTVMLTSVTVNSPLALSGTLALGLAGQAGFALLSDLWGWFGLPRRRPTAPDLAAFALVLAGSLLVIAAGAL
jgi:transporter family-2 protein